MNDQREHAEELATLLHQWNLGRHVNIIPYNPIADSEFERPSKARVRFLSQLLSHFIKFVLYPPSDFVFGALCIGACICGDVR